MENKKITYIFISGRKERILNDKETFAKEFFYGFNYFKDKYEHVKIVEFKEVRTIFNLFYKILNKISDLPFYGDYLINKEEIIEKHCQNKDKPVMKCNGKCHLKKQVSKKIKVEKTSSNHPFNLPIKPFENFNAYCNEIRELEKKIQSYLYVIYS